MPSILGSLRAGFRRRRTYNTAFARSFDELAALSARELSDLGISRADIGRIAREEAERSTAHRL